MIKIGFTKKTHGLNGGIKIHIEQRYLEDFMNVDHVFIEINGTKVPYFIEDVRAGNELIVQLEEINDVNAAKLMTSKEIFLKSEQILTPQERTLKVKGEEYFDIEGFLVANPDGTQIGEITELMQMPGQMMATVKTLNGEKFIPLNEHFVVLIDRQKKLVVVDLPEGLLDL